MTENELTKSVGELNGHWAYLSKRSYGQRVFIRNNQMFELAMRGIHDPDIVSPFQPTNVPAEDIRTLILVEPTESETLLSNHFFPEASS